MYHLLWKMSSRTLGPRLPVCQMEQTPFRLFSGIFVPALTLPLVHLFAEIKELSVLLSCLDVYKRIVFVLSELSHQTVLPTLDKSRVVRDTPLGD